MVQSGMLKFKANANSPAKLENIRIMTYSVFGVSKSVCALEVKQATLSIKQTWSNQPAKVSNNCIDKIITVLYSWSTIPINGTTIGFVPLWLFIMLMVLLPCVSP